jgi:hypothetical protein
LRRLLMVLGVGALMAAMMALMAAPAMAQANFDFFDDDDDDEEDFRTFGFNDDFGNLGVDNESESGAVDLEFDVSNTGDYASQCVPATQFGNTGNFNNAPTLVQGGSGGGFVAEEDDDNGLIGDIFGFGDDDNDDFDFRGGDSVIDDFEPGGIEFSVSPEVDVDCSNTIQQSSAASSTPYYYPYYY